MTNISTNDELFGRYLDGTADEGDIAVLRERLLADDGAADSLVAIARFETLIRSQLVDSNRSREIEDLLETNVPTNPAEVIPALFPLPTLSTAHYPLPTNFIDGPVFSYLVATVVLCLMLLGAWAHKITRVEMMVEDKPAINSIEDSGYKVVGHVSGMKDCVWAKDGLMTMVGASVPMGRKYALSSGLLEITYASGARVILEGPCTYKIASSSGGFLERGKLVARVEKKVASGQRLVASAKPQAVDLQSPTPNPQPLNHSLSTLRSPLFTVSTPTAIITDLGTEFGVEVAGSGDTTSHVFRGSVRVQSIGAEKQEEMILLANESAHAVRDTDSGVVGLLAGSESAKPPQFVRRMPRSPQLRIIDLLDIVAGGNGLGKLREQGINPCTGEKDDALTPEIRSTDGQYHAVPWNRFVDGVFIPDGKNGLVQLDSAGHKWEGITPTCGKTIGLVWPRTATDFLNVMSPNSRSWSYWTTKESNDTERGMLTLQANVGITFDLDAIKKAHKYLTRFTRFRAIAVMAFTPENFATPDQFANIHIFVDGKVRYERMGLEHKDEDQLVNVDLKAGDRYLTLVSTDADGEISCDQVSFGDPVLHALFEQNEQP